MIGWRSRSAWASGRGGDDRVPDDVKDRAKAAYERRSAGPVAAIVSDYMDEHGVRHVVFAHGRLHVRLAISRAGGRWDLNAIVDPPQLRAELELEATTVTVAEDATGGRFAFEGVPGGVMGLRLVAAEAAETVMSDWFNV